MPLIEEIVNATINATNATTGEVEPAWPYAPGFKVPGLGESEEDKSKQWSAFIMTMTALMVLFFIGAGVVEKYKPVICHETGLVLIVGICFSWVYFFAVGDSQREVFRFSQGVFFDFFLPPIIINSGYNMRRKKFFQNLGNVAIFGLGVTFVCFALYSVMTYLFISNGLLYMTNYY